MYIQSCNKQFQIIIIELFLYLKILLQNVNYEPHRYFKR